MLYYQVPPYTVRARLTLSWCGLFLGNCYLNFFSFNASPLYPASPCRTLDKYVPAGCRAVIVIENSDVAPAVRICLRRRAGQFRYFLLFSILKNDFLHFLSSKLDWEWAF